MAKVCDMCPGKTSGCSEASNVTKVKALDDFDSIAYDFYDKNRNFFSNQSLSYPNKPLRSVDVLDCDNVKCELSLIEIKEASAFIIAHNHMSKIKEKFIDSLFILSHLKPGILINRCVIATPDNYRAINRARSSIPTHFSRTQNIDDVYYFGIRGSLFSQAGLGKKFCYPPIVPIMKHCRDAV